MKTLRVSLKSLHGEFIGYKSFVVVYFFWHSFFSCAYDIMFRYHVPSLAVWLDSRYLYQSEKYALKIICITKKSLTTTSHSKQYENAALQELHIIHTLQVCYVC